MAAHPAGVTSVPGALQVVTWVGVVTAVFAASIAVAQTDIKRILAYSTVSQLGFMMLGLGTGGVAVGMFHLITHAFFKALLFLGAGSVIHGCRDEQDIRRMGGLRTPMPWTFAAYAVGMLALSGFPLLFSGFWSKDEILHYAHGWSTPVPFYLGIVAALLTAFYMTRQVCLVFLGSAPSSQSEGPLSEPFARLTVGRVSPGAPAAVAQTRTFRAASAPRGALGETRPTTEPLGHIPDGTHISSAATLSKSEPPHVGCYEAHESPPVMLIPLLVLAAFSVLLGFIGTPAWPWFQDFLNGESSTGRLGRLLEPPMLGLMVASSVVVFAGLGLGWWLYGRKPARSADQPDAVERYQPEIFTLLKRKYFVDEIYAATVIRFNAWGARACDWLDYWVWNGVVQLFALLVVGFAWLNRSLDEYVVNPGFDEGCRRLTKSGTLTSRLQGGRVQTYLRLIGVALGVLVLFLIWGCCAS